MKGGKRFYSGKNKFYGYKGEGGVFRNGIALGCISHFPVGVSDFEIIQLREKWHKYHVKKSTGEQDIAVGMHSDRYTGI